MKNSLIFKILIFLFIFVAIVFFIVFVFIVPSIKDLNDAKQTYKKSYNKYMYANEDLLTHKKELKTIKHETLKISRAFSSKFKEDDFLKFSKKYFKEVQLSKNDEKTYKKDFKEYKFTTISKISDPTVFYRFLSDINRYDNIIQTDFPIQMEAVNDDINTTFILKVFTLKNPH